MGYITKDIAVITEPKKVSLSAAPNFVQFASKAAVKTLLEYNVQVNINAVDTDVATKTVLRVTEPSGIIHAFHGTTDPLQVSGTIFYVAADRSDTAENLREVMLNDKWINANLEITIPAVYTAGVLTNGRVLNIKSKGTGLEYNAAFAAPNNVGNAAYTITAVHATSINNDSISGEEVTAEIELDIYTGLDIRLGENDVPITAAKIGTLELVMQKTYAGVPLWFDVNAIFSQYQDFNIPPDTVGWFDAGTARAFRFTARKKAVNSFAFYQSSALFVLSGYGYASEDLDLTPYVYTEAPIKLLTNKPITPYILGQREYLNFILSDFLSGAPSPSDYNLKVVYVAYTTSDQYIGRTESHLQSRALFKTVNTCVLDIDAALALFPKAGIIRVALGRDEAIVSNYLEYLIRPQELHQLTQVSFLNRFGGWDAFNFDAPIKYDAKPQIETYNKTLTPEFKKGGSLETVYTSALEDPRTIEGAPVTDDMAEWLKELAASRVVLDGEGNYIIKEDFSLQVSANSSNMHVPIIKYRLSETYTND